MPESSENTRFYSRILTEQPANNPPYLTKTGGFFVTLCALFAFGAAATLGFELDIWFRFLSACTAMTVFLMALLYGVVLLSWRAFQIGLVRSEMQIHAQKLAPNDKFEIVCRVTNPLFWPICSEASRLDLTPCIESTNDDELSEIRWFRQKNTTEFTIHLKALGVGHAAILGQAIVVTDPLRIFRAEIHVETGFELPIYPARPPQIPGNDEFQGAIHHYLAPNRIQQSDDFETQKIRLWQSGDGMRRILWRGYAKRQELMVRVPEPRQQNCLLCLVDAGPHMRLVTSMQGFDNPLITIVEKITKCACDFDLISIIVYDEYSASTLVSNMQPDAAVSRLETWLLQTLRYHHAYDQDNGSTQLAIAATQINQAFRLYKGVDFKRRDKDGLKIDLQNMVQWGRADWVSQAFKQNDKAAAIEISHLPYPVMLEKLIQYWYREPMTMLPPNPNPPQFSDALRLVLHEIMNGSITLLTWFSDFAEPLDSHDLQNLTDALFQTHLPAIGIQMHMPLHSLNYIAAKGTLSQQANIKMLAPVMSFVK